MPRTEFPGQFLVAVETTPLGHCARSFMWDSMLPAPPYDWPYNPTGMTPALTQLS